jgi:isopropylmalate/homocitrate/citramalate synthase
MPVDLTRADLRFAEQVVTEAVKEGAGEIIIVDTIGVMTPEAMAYLTRQIRSWVDVPLDAHVHNDFGLGVANTLAALKAGAHCAHVSVNCLGERAGNVDLAEVVVALELLYGVSTGIRLERLRETARLVEEQSGYKLSLTKPIVGQCVFTRESGGVVQQMLASPPSVEPFDPGLVGLERAVVLGKKSGRHSIVHALGRLGLTATEGQIDAALAKVKELSTRQRRAITDEEFKKILAGAMPA